MPRHGSASGRGSRRAPSRLVEALAAGVLIAVPAGLAAQAAQTHTVRTGDTLWSLSQQYLGDPLLWPELFRLNTNVVEDPHWIYPGEVLRLIAGEGVAAVPTEDTPPPPPVAPDGAPSDTVAAPAPGVLGGAPLDDLPAGAPLFPIMGRQLTARETIRAYSEQNYRPLRRSEFYAASFFTEGADLPYGVIAGRVTPPDIKSLRNADAAKLYTELAVRPPNGATYEVGDSILTLVVVPRSGDLGNLVIPTGIARVVKNDGENVIVSVVKIFEPIYPGHKTLPLDKFSSAGNRRAVPVSEGVQAVVVDWPGFQELKLPQKNLLLDKGRAAGVAPGDIFELRRTPGKREDGTVAIDEPIGMVQIVRAGDRSATAVVLTLKAGDIGRGTRVRQVAKLPS